MERERPEYLPPIEPRRWSFPWLALWAALLLGMAGAGISLHLRTNAAWIERFQNHKAASADASQPTAQQAPAQESAPELTPAEKEAYIAHIRMRRERAEREAKRQSEELRCIGGVAFRRIPGGWENVPGATCP